jgi:lactate dehydrogenase-like 2-hydroxyacid dehydrogenase
LVDLLGFECVPLDERLACGDIITLHLPDNPHSRYLLDRPPAVRAREGYVRNVMT